MALTSTISRPVVLCLKADKEKIAFDYLKSKFKKVEFACADSLANALQYISDRQVAILLFDPNTPGGEGVGFLSQVRRVSPHTLKVLLNCTFNPELMVEAINKGKVWKCISHPWENQDLDDLIKEGLEHWNNKRAAIERPIVERPDFYLQLVRQISDLLNQSEELDYILQKAVSIISNSLNYNVVSIYLWSDSESHLQLRATVGLRMELAEPVSLSPKEGLTGYVFSSRRPIVAMPASKHPYYKFFPGLGEEQYESYIGIPIILGSRSLGVLVAQSREQRYFSPAEETLLQIITSRLAGLLDLANRMERIHPTGEKKSAARVVFQGKGVSSGYAVGKTYILRGLFKEVSLDHLKFTDEKNEIRRVQSAFTEVEEEQKELIENLAKQGNLSQSDLNIFKAHLMIMQDKSSFDAICKLIKAKSLSAERAVVEGFEAFAAQFESQDDRFFQERVQDFRDIGEKILKQLLDSRGDWTESQTSLKGAVVVAEDINPTLLPSLNEENVAAIVTEKGGVTSHAAILAKSLGIPAVSGVENICRMVTRGERLLVDGRTGLVFINPDEQLLDEYQRSSQHQSELYKAFEEANIQASDFSIPVHISANVGFPIDVELASKYKMENVGLYRTEFAFMQYETWPSLLEQYRIYERVATRISGYITVRTLDIGADKLLPYFKFPKEENPMLGLRSIRFSMEYLDFFKDQIKAILLGIKNGYQFRILLPMVSRLWELETARNIIEEAAVELEIPPNKMPPLGVMAEVPAVLHLLEDFQDDIEFISVGTNDLIQYLLAVDRNSNIVSHLYSHSHPAVIRMLFQLRKQGEKLGLEVAACGEMAGTLSGALTLFSLGYKNLSILPSRTPAIKYMASKLTPRILSEVRQKILKEKRQKEVESYLNEKLESLDARFTEAE